VKGDLPASEVRSRLRYSPVQKADMRTDRIPQEKELLRRSREPEYRTDKIKCNK
jgi:hypothetical protein